MPLYFLRHGESVTNLQGLFTGREDATLTTNGELQAHKAATKIKDLNISLIITSPLKRAVRTADIVARDIGYDISKIVTDRRITEYDIGELTGKPWRKVPASELIGIKGAEPLDEFQSRLINFLSEYKDTKKDILIVSHGGVYRMIEASRQGLNPKFFHSIDRPSNVDFIKLDLKWLD